MSLSRQAASGVKWNTLAMGSNVFLHIVTLAVLARLLEPGDFGLKGMAMVVMGFAAAFADAGVSNAIIHRRAITAPQLASLYWLNLAVGIGLFFVVWISAPLVVAFYDESRLSPIVRWSAVSFCVGPIGHQFGVMLRRNMRFKLLSVVSICRTLATSAITISLAAAGFGVMSLVWGSLIGGVVASASFLAIASRYGWLPAFTFSPRDVKEFVSFGMFQIGERCMNFLAQNVDYVIIGRFLGAGPLGYYTLAYQLVNVPRSQINPLLTAVAFPVFARVQDDNARLRRGYVKMLQYLSTASFPMMAGLFAVAPLFVPIIYGAQWTPAVPVVQIFCLLGALVSLGNPIGSLLLAKGRADLGFYLNVLAVFGYAASNLIAVRWGITGVAASSLIFQCAVMWPLSFYVYRVLIRMNPSTWFGAIRRAATATLTMIAVIVPLRFASMHALSEGAQLAVVVLLGAAVYAIAIQRLDRPLFSEAWQYLAPPACRRCAGRREGWG